MTTVTMPARAVSAASLRRHLADDLADQGAGPALIDDAVLVASELFGNAVSHADLPESGQIEISWHFDASGLNVCVTDGGGGRPQCLHAQARDVHGRGLSIIDRMSDGWGYRTQAGLKTVWAHLPS